MSCPSISVIINNQHCPIYVGQDLLSQADILLQHITGQQVMIVTQETIARHYLKPLQQLLQHYQCDVLKLPEGEQNKTIEQWLRILDLLIQNRHERSTTLIALGGGVVGDVTGFAAACYQRGVNYIQIPTTLIAQVDAAIGGKTAINHTNGKNMIGAFYQPQCVISDVTVLKTLPDREFISGLAEVIKYGLIADAEFFGWLESQMPDLLAKDDAALLHAIYICSKIKSEIVSQDERDRGLRNTLNLGHTFGHAIEVANGYQKILHGEAVAIGIAMAAKLSSAIGWLENNALKRILNLLNVSGLLKKTDLVPSAVEFIQCMRSDKKIHDGKFNLLLLKDIGCVVKTSEVTEAQLLAFLDE